MYVLQVTSITLLGRADNILTKSAWDAASDFASKWKAQGNVKALVAPSRGDAIQKARDHLKQGLIPPWLGHRGVDYTVFGFHYDGSEVDEEGFFWLPRGCGGGVIELDPSTQKETP